MYIMLFIVKIYHMFCLSVATVIITKVFLNHYNNYSNWELGESAVSRCCTCIGESSVRVEGYQVSGWVQSLG